MTRCEGEGRGEGEGREREGRGEVNRFSVSQVAAGHGSNFCCRGSIASVDHFLLPIQVYVFPCGRVCMYPINIKKKRCN